MNSYCVFRVVHKKDKRTVTVFFVSCYGARAKKGLRMHKGRLVHNNIYMNSIDDRMVHNDSYVSCVSDGWGGVV